MIRNRAPLAAIAVALLLPFVAARAHAQITADHNVAFTAKGQSPYAPGKALEIYEPGLRVLSKPLATNSGPIIDINAWDVALGGLLPSDLLPNIFSLKAGFGVFGSNNLDLGYYVSGGRLDITYPASSKLTFATDKIINDDVVLANNRYKINSQFLPGVSQRSIPSDFWTKQGPGGPDLWLTKTVTGEGGFQFRVGPPPPTISAPSFIVHSPYASAWLDSSVDVRVGAYVRVEALGGLIDEGVDFTFGVGAGERLAEIDPSGLYISGSKVSDVSLTDPIPISIPVPGGTATLSLPSLGLASTEQQGKLLRGHDVKPVLTMSADLERMIPAIGPFLQGKVGPFGYSLLNLQAGPVASLYQDMSFDPHPEVRLQFSEPVQVLGAQCGDAVCAGAGSDYITTTVAKMSVEGATLNWQPLFSNSSKITVSPTYILKNDFTNKVGVDVSLEGRVKALEVTHPFGKVGPIVNEALHVPLFQEELYSEKFNVPISDVIASRVNIPKANRGIVDVGVGDLKFSQFFFRGVEPNGVVTYDLEFSRTVVEPGGGQSVVTSLVTGVQTRNLRYWNGIGEDPFACIPGEECNGSPIYTPQPNVYAVIEALNDVVINDPFTNQPLNLGRHFLHGDYDLTSQLPEVDPKLKFTDDLGDLFVNPLPEVPATDVVTRPILEDYSGQSLPPTTYNSQGTPIVQDRRNGPRTTILAMTGQVDPEPSGKFNLLFFPITLDNSGAARFDAVVDPFVGEDNAEGLYYADGTTSAKLVRTGDSTGVEGESFLMGEIDFRANDADQIAFKSSVSGSANRPAIFRQGPDGVAIIARDGDPAPDGNGTITNWQEVSALNDAGQITVSGTISVNDPANPRTEVGMYRGDEHGLTKIARTGDSVPGLAGALRGTYAISLNDAGRVLFGGGDFERDGIFIGDGNSVSKVAATGDSVPGGGTLEIFVDSMMNASGEVALNVLVDRPAPGRFFESALLKWTGTELISIATKDQANSAQLMAMNDAGEIAFNSTEAVYFYDASLAKLVEVGQAAPAGGIFAHFLGGEEGGRMLLNENGQLSFNADISDGGQTRRGIFIYDGTNTIEVARTGQDLAGSTITHLEFGDMNDQMQVAYQATLTDGRQVIARFEPDNYWRGSATGSWDSETDWSLRVDPTAPYNAFIMATNPVVVAGPAANASVHSLTLGGAQTAEAELKLQEGVQLTVTDGVTVRPSGVLSGKGTIAGDVTNLGGVVSPGSSPGVLRVDGDFVQDSVGRLLLEIAGPDAGTQHDVLDVTGSILLGGDVVLAFLDGYVPAPGTRFNLLQFGENFDALQANFFLADAPAGLQVNPFVEDGVFGLSIAAIPEPSAPMLIGWGVALIAGRSRTRNRRRH